ncbi:YwbE family protein [Paenibacillus sp. SYP-B4298]|uniref:YwbE family protein n=1 Tax=Paenibacillus sp. SYP-B4298 TaxID=2996034 RepID=UPI0022DCE666|nr:YwbE family protein [Paenibacillus sp. SYP-B4298]
MNGNVRASVRPGLTVDIVLKQDQRTGKLTRGIVKDILTNSPQHPHGIKVRLQSGQVGRVKTIIAAGEAAPDQTDTPR